MGGLPSVRGQPRLQNEFQAIMDYCIRPCIKREVEEKIYVRKGGKYPSNRPGFECRPCPVSRVVLADGWIYVLLALICPCGKQRYTAMFLHKNVRRLGETPAWVDAQGDELAAVVPRL